MIGWEGYGTALKPACEPICLARKPLVGSVAANVLAHGTGAVNIDACRIGDGGQWQWSQPRGEALRFGGDKARMVAGDASGIETCSAKGRWPANVVLDEEAARMLDEQSGDLGVSSGGGMNRDGSNPTSYEITGHRRVKNVGHGDSGGASRFFFVAKASRADRGERNDHPTVKPLDLMRYLIRLVTPPGGTVLDPFMGSGTTLLACQEEGFKGIGVELNSEYIAIARRRLSQEVLDFGVPA